MAQAGTSPTLRKRSRIQSPAGTPEQVEDEDDEGDAADPGGDAGEAAGERLGRSATEARLAADEDVPAHRRADSARRPARCRHRPGAAGPRLQRCDLGLPRPFRCGHVVAPMRRADPALGATRVAFALRTRVRPRRAPRWGRSWRWTAAPATPRPTLRSPARWSRCWRRCCAATTSSSSTSAAPGARRSSTARACRRALIEESDRGRRMRQPARPALRRLHHGRSRARSRGGARALGLGKVFFYGDSYGTLFGQAYAVRYPGSLRGLVLDSAYPGDDPYYRTLLPAGLDGLRITCRHSPSCGGDPVARFARVVRRFHAAGRSTEGLLDFLLQAGTLAPRSYLSLDEADRRFLAGEPRRLNELIAPGPRRPRRAVRILYGLEIAVECNDYPLLWDSRRRGRRAHPPALGRGHPPAEGPLRAVRAPRVPALLGGPPDQLPDLAGAAARRPRAAGAGRLARPDHVPDPDPRRPGRRHHLGGGGAAGASGASHAPASTWCRTAATPRASTSPSARREWARSGTSSLRTESYGRYFSACFFASSMPFSAWALPSSMPFSACSVPSSMPFLALPLLSSPASSLLRGPSSLPRCLPRALLRPS